MDCAHCGKTFLKRHSLVQHLKNHARTAGNKDSEFFFSMKFLSLTDFYGWKQKVEEETCSYFSKGRKTKSKLVTYQYYKCNRSGVFTRRGKGIKRMKSQGTCKVGKKCPAQIITHQNITDGSVSVKYYPEHNHEVVIQHLRIQKPVRDFIAEKLSEGVPKKKILDDVKEDCAQSGKVNRNSLITMKDLTNIARDYNIQRSIQHYTDTSVQLWVEECKIRPESNPVLYFKEQNDEDPLKRFGKKDFVLIIMSQFQKEMLSKFGCDKICVEGTLISNPYNYTLHTLLIIDEFNNGCPVACCISNKKTQMLYKTFFEYVRENAGNIKSKVFMSDDKSTYYNAWQEVMGPSEHQFVCTWHLYEDWKKNLRKIPGTEIKKSVFQSLKILQEETDVNNFRVMKSNFILGLEEDEALHPFKDYFVGTYSKRSEMWAVCYRKHLGLNMNILESLHQQIKYHCSDGARNRRLDLIIHALLKMVRDLALHRMTKITEKAVPYARIKQIDDNHQSSHNLSFNTIPVEEDENMKWSVTSTTTSDVTYTVEYTAIISCDCNHLCSACNICIHTFTCSCTNNMINFTICKHIHAVAKNLVFEDSSLVLNDGQASDVDSSYFQTHTLENSMYSISSKEVSTYSSSLLTKAETLLEKIMKFKLKDRKKIEEIHQHLDKCLLIFDKLESSKS